MNHGRTDARTHGRTTRKHIASAGAYRRRRLNKKVFGKLALKICHLCYIVFLEKSVCAPEENEMRAPAVEYIERA